MYEDRNNVGMMRILSFSWAAVLTVVFVTCGCLNTILYKLQSENGYIHPWTQNLQMFIGMTMFSLPIYRLQVWLKKNKNNEEENSYHLPPIDPRFFIIPAVCDSVASVSLNFALISTDASVYQQLQSVTVVFVGILSYFLIGRKVYAHSGIGWILITIGALLVTYSATTSTISVEEGGSENITSTPALLGPILVIIADLIYSLFYIIEEKTMVGYDVTPYQAVAYEGLFGFVITVIILFILYFIPGSDHGSVENFPFSVTQMLSNPFLLKCVVFLVLSIGIYNFMGNCLTVGFKTRIICDFIRTSVIWSFQLWRGKEVFSFVQLIGFVLLVLGTCSANMIGFGWFIPGYQKRIEYLENRYYSGGDDPVLDDEEERMKFD